ncbi:MAG TPA: glycoside hydrolase family 32 protein [Microlunatus sp.]|nr:glycoside hydrolase family 32 protein [Microlunatus sp.]
MDPARPRLHVLPPSGWLNDPNGVSRIDGRYHVFYQHNPDGPTHGNIHWGHASSTDLVHWADEPVALAPTAGSINQNGCWSGCVVDDGGVPTAVYTAVQDHAGNAGVAVARSDRTLLQWEQDPELKIGTPEDPAIGEVRDPYVFRFRGRRYAVQGAGHHEGEPQLLLYACDDLDDWTLLGPLLTYQDPVAAAVAPANIWECPNLFELGARWVLVLSLWRRVDDRHELSGVRYLTGDLVDTDDGLRFVAEYGGSVDTGPTFYAPQVLVDGGRALLWGWAWEGADRTAQEISDAGWAGTLTFPRELSLGAHGLISQPAAELVSLRTVELEPGTAGVIDDAAFEVQSTGPLELALIDPATGRREAVSSTTGACRVLVDGSIVEVFGAGASTTSRHYPTHGSRWEVRAVDGYRAWRLG